MRVAALFVERDGVYAGLPDVDVWDEQRDARRYAGPHPVVAHPPCARWCALAALNEVQYGYPIGDDGGCFEAALLAVRRFGGVLEHPAHSLAWAHFALPTPARSGWAGAFDDPGWATEVSQVAYGHPARKRTWLYYIGPEPPALDWREPPATGVVGFPRAGVAPHLRRLGPNRTIVTPRRFRDVLLDMARSAQAVAA